jgi:hypothetical protein
MLIDLAVRHFREWMLVGRSNVSNWRSGDMVYNDIVNQYILEGLAGGALTMILFIAVIIACFACIGELMTRRVFSGDDERLAWGLGVSLFTHAVMFLVVSYFGQIVMLWNILLALIVSLAIIYLPGERAIARANLEGNSFSPVPSSR